MRLFLYLLLFTLLFFVSDQIFYFTINEVEKSFYGASDYPSALKEYIGENSYDTLVIGTSRTYEGVHPVYIEKALGRKPFRDADHGRGPRYCYYAYKEFKKSAGIPKLVIYGVDYFIFSVISSKRLLSRFPERYQLEDGSEVFSSASLLLGDKKNLDTVVEDLLKDCRDFIKNSYKNRKEKQKDIIDRLQKHKGAIPFKDKLLTIKPKKDFYVKYPAFPGVEGGYFCKLIEELHRDGVKVMLVILPDHYGTYETNFQKGYFLEELKGLTSEFGNVSIYNYNSPELFPMEDGDMFLDGGYGNPNSHLSSKGAEYLFDNLLIKDLKTEYIEADLILKEKE